MLTQFQKDKIKDTLPLGAIVKETSIVPNTYNSYSRMIIIYEFNGKLCRTNIGAHSRGNRKNTKDVVNADTKSCNNCTHLYCDTTGVYSCYGRMFRNDKEKQRFNFNLQKERYRKYFKHCYEGKGE